MSRATEFVTECTVTYVWVHAGATRHGPLAHDTRVIVDNCTGEESAVSGRAAPTVFRFSDTDLTARLVATIPLTDVGSGRPAGEVTVDNTWNAITEAGNGHGAWVRATFRSPGGYRVSVRSHGRFALAEVTGALQVDNATIGRRSSLRISVSACPGP